MSVLIKGMNMPKEGECQALIIHSDGSISVNLNSTNYRAVEVPTPHGRLIDADKLLEVLDKTQKEFEADTFGNLHIDYISDEFNDAPTVIEAEE